MATVGFSALCAPKHFRSERSLCNSQGRYELLIENDLFVFCQCLRPKHCENTDTLEQKKRDINNYMTRSAVMNKESMTT